MATGPSFLTLTLVGDVETVGKLREFGPGLLSALSDRMGVILIGLQGYIVSRKLHGQVLKQRTGQLANSIQASPVTALAMAVFGRVFSAGDVKYAAIHEFGGVIEHPGGTAYIPGQGLAMFVSNARAAEIGADGWSLPRTRPHPIPIPERSYMRSSLRENQGRITNQLRETAATYARGQFPG